MTDLHSLAKSLSQYWQSAALPDMVPSRYGLISMTLLTSLDAAEQKPFWKRRHLVAQVTTLMHQHLVNIL